MKKLVRQLKSLAQCQPHNPAKEGGEPDFTLDQAFSEANRCLLCFDAPCSKGCPSNTEPGTFIRKLKLRNIKGAVSTIKNNNILGGICGALCPTSSLCEKECSATPIDRPVQIGKIQRFLVDYSRKLNFNPLEKKESGNIKIAIIGSGPSGLSCAAELAKRGFRADVFEAKLKPGGMLRYLIPGYRLSEKFLDKEIKDIVSLGVKIKCNFPVRTEKDLKKLFDSDYKAVYIATGTWQMQSLGLKSNFKGFYEAGNFLEKCKGAGMAGLLKNRTVCVIGGGDTAVNTAETAKRFGAKDVSIIYRRSFLQMPGSEKEKLSALKSGINFLILTQPLKYLSIKGKITGIEVTRNKLGAPDSSGRPSPVPVKNSRHIINTDIVIEAIGFKPSVSNKALFAKLKLSKKGLIIIDEKTGKTNRKNVYAGGDITRGPALIVEAVADGKRAAETIIKKYVESGESRIK